jgi:transmembrane sensor
MSGNRRRDRMRLVSEEAAEWFIRCSDERNMLLADRRELLAWMRRSPENIAELLRIAKLDGKIGQGKLILSAAGFDESNVVDLAVHTGGSPSELHAGITELDDQEHYQRMNKKSISGWKLAAIVAAVTVASLFGFVRNNLSVSESTVVTQASQWQTMTLEDGTIVHVGARTKLRVDFSKERRTVHLERGEAVFEVAKDPNRPFTVSTHLIDATALGTRFGVRIDPGVTTTVSEGVVLVTARGKTDENEAVRLIAGDELRVSDSGFHLPTVEKVKVDAQRKLEWANGWLVFEGETIGEVAHEFNRRNAVQIRIEHPELAARRVDFTRFRVGSPDEFAKLVDEQQPDVSLKGDRNVLRLQLE